MGTCSSAYEFNHECACLCGQL